MTKHPTLFIIPIYNIQIDQPLGDSYQINNGLYLSNDKDFIESLITERFKRIIGGLEYSGLTEYSDCVAYSISQEEVTSSNIDDFLTQKIMFTKAFLKELWMIKDHAANLALGYVQVPYYKPSGLHIPITKDGMVHSNQYSLSNYSLANGRTDNIIYSIDEIAQAVKYGVDRKIAKLGESSNSTKYLNLISRISRATYFLGLARVLPDLGLRIAQYCSVLECLFASDNHELKHKLSERTALFLSDDANKRKEIYDVVSDSYKIRSKVIHGDKLSSKHAEKLEGISVECDNIIRMVMIKLQETPELDKFFREVNTNSVKKEFDLYFLDKILESSEGK